MANNFAGNPMVIDTAFATVVAGDALWGLTSMNIDHFEFVGYALNTDNVLVQDLRGVDLWRGNGASDLEEVRSGKIGGVRGFVVPTLTSGKLKVYFWK